MDEAFRDATMASLHRRLHLATAVITAVTLLGLALPLLVVNASTYRSLASQITAMAILTVVIGVAGGFLWRRRPLRWMRWVLLAAVCVAAVLATTGIAPELLVAESEWSYGVIGGFGLVLLLDKGAGAVLAFLGAHVFLSYAQLILLGQDTASLAVVTVLVLGFQLPMAASAQALRRFATAAARTARIQEELRTAEAIAEQLHADRKARYADLADTAVPLLADLATGVADLADDRVRAAYLLEAARMRRLFAESDDVPDPLLHELGACADLAERRGVAVYLGSCGDRPGLPVPMRRILTEPAIQAMARAVTEARVTVLGTPTAVTVSVVADVGSAAAAQLSTKDEVVDGGPIGTVAVTRMVDQDRIWVEATWQPTR